MLKGTESIEAGGNTDHQFGQASVISFSPVPAIVPGPFVYQEKSVPLSIFSAGILSCMEAIVKYLHESAGMRFCQIASVTGRDDRSVWNSYNDARNKMPQPFCNRLEGEALPLSVIIDRRLSVLESISLYLKDNLGYRNCRIASILGRDDRTIWTILSRAKKKRGCMDR